MKQIKVAFLSAGLGNISRGFEVSTANWFREVSTKQEINAMLFSGGRYDQATRVWNCPRNGSLASVLRKLNLIKDGVRLEQVTFAFGFFIHIIKFRPDVVWLKEVTLGDWLLRFRKLGFKYKIIFCDGAPVGHAVGKRFDYLSFLHKYGMNDAIGDGIAPQRCAVTPNLTHPPTFVTDKQFARKALDIDPDRFVIICVAAWNKHHKRIDYLLEEVAKINHDSITVLLCGQPEADADSLKDTAIGLGIDARWHTFRQEDLSKAYFASDLFILPSLNEALGSVITEAALHGLPVICHPHYGAMSILGEDYPGLTDISIPGALSKKITNYRDVEALAGEGARTSGIVREKFDKGKLVAEFIRFIKVADSN